MGQTVDAPLRSRSRLPRSRSPHSRSPTSSGRPTGPTRGRTGRSLPRRGARCRRPARSAPPSPGTGPGQVNVVCQGRDGRKSLNRLERSVQSGREQGYRLRPSQDKTFLNRTEARRLLRINRSLAGSATTTRSRRRSSTPATTTAWWSCRVATGEAVAAAAHQRPRVRRPRSGQRQRRDGAELRVPGHLPERPEPDLRPGPRGAEGAAALAAARGARGDPGPRPVRSLQPPARGLGVKPTDVIMDAGKNYKRKGANAKPGTANGCGFEPECSYDKHVVLRVDRADGFVGRNFLTKSSLEHGVYLEEVDGYLLDKTKFFWSAEYGNLTFTSDHGLYKNCDSYGAGDAAVYPGAAPGDRRGRGEQGLLPGRAADQHRRQAVRPALERARLLRLAGQRGADHATTRSTRTRPGRDGCDLGRRAIRATRPTASWSTTTTSTPTTSTPTTTRRS